MNKESTKWLIIGLSGVVTMVILLSIIGFSLTRYLAETEKISGQEQWQAEIKHQETTQQELEATGIEAIYDVVSPHGDSRERIYEQHDFTAINAHLTTQFQAISTPMEAYYYSGLIANIADPKHSDNPEDMLKTLDQWVETTPDSR